jgi:hypothetical protein
MEAAQSESETVVAMSEAISHKEMLVLRSSLSILAPHADAKVPVAPKLLDASRLA